jgi:chemotaxis protein CheC
MSSLEVTSQEQWQAVLHEIACEGVARAAEGFAGMLGEQVIVTAPSTRMVALNAISSVLGGPESEAVGVYLQAEGDLPGQIILVLPYVMAMELVDVLMDEPLGTTQQLGPMERSALAEVGNITGTFFLNAAAAITGLEVRPTPPAVMVDMLGAVLDVLAAVCGGAAENVLVLQAAFRRGDRAMEVEFWVVPDQVALERLAARGVRHDR